MLSVVLCPGVLQTHVNLSDNQSTHSADLGSVEDILNKISDTILYPASILDPLNDPLRQKFKIHIFHMDELDSVCPVWFFLTGAVPASRRVSGSVFSHGFPAVRLPAGVVLPQRSPLELGRSDHAVGPADPPAEGWIWNLQSGTHPVFTCSPGHFNLQRLCFDVWCFILRPKQETLWKWLKCCSKLFFFSLLFLF